MDNVIHPRQKTYFVTKNKNHVFGTDFAVRESMTSDEAKARFDEVWEQHLKPAILGGSPVDAADVRLRVAEANRTHVNPTACHREFRLSGSLWIAQCDTSAEPEKSRDWRLAVKRGRDGKDGATGPRGEKGEPGKDGRDLTQIGLDGKKW